MPDSRFASTVDDLDALLQVVDVDEVGDIETLLMFIFARPIEVGETLDDVLGPSLHVIVRGNEESVGFSCDFPMSVIELARSCAQVANELGPFNGDEFVLGNDVPDVLAMSDGELIGALQQSLGMTRMFNMLDDGD
jgi:hypothetical protein